MLAMKKIMFEAPFKPHHKSSKEAQKKKKTDVEENLKQNPKSCLHIFHLQQNVKNTLRVPSTHKMEVACTEAIHNMKVQTI